MFHRDLLYQNLVSLLRLNFEDFIRHAIFYDGEDEKSISRPLSSPINPPINPRSPTKGMNSEKPYRQPISEHSLQEIEVLVWATAQQAEGNNIALLSLLRVLEALHRKVREELFEPSLPETRNDLYHLLREIEELSLIARVWREKEDTQ
jgi:hypothetical protein